MNDTLTALNKLTKTITDDEQLRLEATNFAKSNSADDIFTLRQHTICRWENDRPTKIRVLNFLSTAYLAKALNL